MESIQCAADEPTMGQQLTIPSLIVPHSSEEMGRGSQGEAKRVRESQGESLGVRGFRENQEESVSQGGGMARGAEENKGESMGSMGVKRSLGLWDLKGPG